MTERRKVQSKPLIHTCEGNRDGAAACSTVLHNVRSFAYPARRRTVKVIHSAVRSVSRPAEEEMPPARLERATLSLAARRSFQLSYGGRRAICPRQETALCPSEDQTVPGGGRPALKSVQGGPDGPLSARTDAAPGRGFLQAVLTAGGPRRTPSARSCVSPRHGNCTLVQA